MIEFHNVSFSYNGETNENSVQNIDLSIPGGQTLLITGPSGCGKSTILRLINGLAPHFYEGKVTGKVLVDGQNPSKAPLYEMAERLGSVFQNPRSQFYNVDTNGELAFACENQGMEKNEIFARMERSVQRFHIEELLNKNVLHLSGGQKQQLACASVDVAGPDIFLLDEPSANLDYDATQRLKKMITIWKSEGKTVVIAEHRISWLWELCDRVIVMNKGCIAEDYDADRKQKLTPEQCRKLGLRSLDVCNPSDLKKIDSNAESDVEIHNLCFSYEKGVPVLDIPSIRFPVKKVTALVGYNGVGKTTFLHCLTGMKKKAKGTVRYNGKTFSLKEFGKRVFLVMQDVNHQLFTESVLEEILISMKTENEEKADEILAMLDLSEYRDRHPMSLSGGQKQRVAIACAFASDRDILLFDEPTSGLDFGTMEMTAKLFRQLANMGKTVLVVTHDSELIQCCSDCIVHLRR
ncbi:MAG: ABC transporter ATP-binding protein [Acutalibacteraceae bacterium]